MTLEEKNEILVKFVKEVLWAGGDWCGTFDGADLQDMAEEHKLIQQVWIDEPCGDHCACADVYDLEDFPVHCFEYTEVMK